MSRRNRNKARNGQTYTTFQHWTLKSEAMLALSGNATKLMLRLALRHNGVNNGQITMSVREAANEVRCTTNTATKLFEELERLRFISCTRKGSFSQKHGMASVWLLHWLPRNGQAWDGFGPEASPFMRLPPEATARPPKRKVRPPSVRPTVASDQTVVQFGMRPKRADGRTR